MLATVATAQSTTSAVPGLRLPRNVLPVAYAPTLTIDPGKPTFDAVIEIDVRIETATDRIWINARDLKIGSATAMIAGPGKQARTATVVPGTEDVIGLQFDAPLPTGPAKLVLHYSAPIEAINALGVFRQQDQDRWYVLTQFEPLDARRAFPCFDEPDMKAPWRLTLRVPVGGDGATLFDAVVEVAVSSQDANEREDVLKALGSFRDPPLLDRALALDARFNPRDSTAPR